MPWFRVENRRDVGTEALVAALVEIARAHGLDPATGRPLAVGAITEADEPWTRAEAASYRLFLQRLRRHPAARPPQPHGPDGTAWPEPWASLGPLERRVLASVVDAGLDLASLAKALRTRRLDVKAALRRALACGTPDGVDSRGLSAVRVMMAGEYAVGAVPPSACAALRRAVALDAELQALVARWDETLAPLRRLPAPREPMSRPVAPPRRRTSLQALAAAGLVAVFIAMPAPAGRSEPPAQRAEPAADLRAVAPASPATALPDAGTAAAMAQAVPAPAAVGGAPRPARLADDAPEQPLTAAASVTVRAQARVESATAVAVPVARRALATGSLSGSTGGPIVHLHHAPSAGERAGRIADRLAGIVVGVDLVPAPGLVVRADRLRYFHAADAELAARIVAGLSAPTALQDFTFYEPSPPPGTLELWLANTPPR